MDQHLISPTASLNPHSRTAPIPAGYASGLREECGIFGILDPSGGALQHRGQESCGIAVSSTEGPRRTSIFTRAWGW